VFTCVQIRDRVPETGYREGEEVDKEEMYICTLSGTFNCAAALRKLKPWHTNSLLNVRILWLLPRNL
jgi:hypothetical protein